MHVDLRPATEAIRRGDLKAAHDHCQQALSYDPANAEAISLIGVIAGRMGQHDVAARCMKDALTLRPGDLHYRRNYVIALIELERLDEAAKCVDEALSRMPDHPGLLSLKGLVAGKRGDSETAIAALQAAVDAKPEIPSTRFNLGELYRRTGDHERSIEQFRRCIELDPKHADAMNNLAGVLLRRGEFLPALRHIKQHLDLCPRSAQGYANLSVAMQAGGDLRQAVTCLRNALRLDPSLDDLRYRLIGYLSSSGQLQEAHAELSEWQSRTPDNPRLLATEARLLEREGKLDEAEDTFQRIGDEHRQIIPVMLTEAILLDATGQTERATEKLHQIIRQEPEAIEQIGLRFMLAKCEDALGQHEDAFKNYAAANQARRQGFGTPFEPDKSFRVRDASIQAYQEAWKDRDESSGSQSDMPIFIVGMPRSGTSLSEQILGSHPNVHPAGELSFLMELIRGTHDGASPTESGGGFQIIDHERDGSRSPLIPADFNATTLAAIGERYVDQIRALSNGRPRVTDKMPYNFLHVPLIQMALPRAKIIHTRRHPIDTCLSCFFQNFSSGNEFSFDLEHLAVYYNNYHQMMQAWRDLGVEMLEIDYESLVSDPEPVVRQMLEYCGLDWDDNCLQSHKSKRPVATASYQQVRQPIYTKSVQRWKNYENQLKPLIEALDESLQPDS